jgi:hypothetical protein
MRPTHGIARGAMTPLVSGIPVSAQSRPETFDAIVRDGTIVLVLR